MNLISRHIGELKILGRLPSSKNGNPRYEVSLDGVTCWTQPDSPLAYEINKFNGNICIGTIGTHYGKNHIDTLLEYVG
jgi:hypothetical protein